MDRGRRGLWYTGKTPARRTAGRPDFMTATSRAPSLDHYRNLLLRYLQPQRRRVLLLVGLLLASLAVELVNPLILRAFIDEARAGVPLESLLWLAGIFLAVAVATQVVSVAETYVAQDVGLTATNHLRADLTRHLLHLDLGFHNARTPGELIERVDGDVTTLGNFFSRLVITLIGNG